MVLNKKHFVKLCETLKANRMTLDTNVLADGLFKQFMCIHVT